MHWADKIAKDIIASGKYKPYWVDDMKTPSGRVHIGSVRAALTHELIYRALKDLGEKATFSYVLEDHDPMDGLPVYVDQEEYKKHLGKPLYAIPSPDPGYTSYGERWGKEYIEIFDKIGVHPKIIWGSELYRSGKMNEMVKICLDKAGVIRGIYKTLYGKKRPDDWYPFQVICENCGKLSTTVTYNWDGEYVYYRCNVDGLDWTKGCGFEGRTSPFSNQNKIAGKLPWKVEWPCKWKVIGVTVEGAGKDHMSAGGSHDFAKLVCKKVLKTQVPYAFSHEFFLVGGRKMSSSKGLGTSAKEVSEMLPPYLMRFLIIRVKYNQQINFDPNDTMEIPDLFDDYDASWKAYNEGGDEKLMRAFILSQTDTLPEKEKGFFVPRFRDIANYLSQGLSDDEMLLKFSEIKGGKLDDSELDILEERIKYAKVWIENYAPSEYRHDMAEKVPEAARDLSEEQKKFLKAILSVYREGDDAKSLQFSLYELTKELNVPIKEAFVAIYLAFTGKNQGPRAGYLLTKFGRERVEERIRDVLTENKTEKVKEEKFKYPLLTDTRLFSISESMARKYPSTIVGLAIIKGITVKQNDPLLEEFKNKELAKLEGITIDEVENSAEILSYRRLYKESGVDWAKKKSSPAALLRRIAQGKGLYTLNTCVDAYNLVVMKYKVSAGAFDLDHIKLPTILDIAKGGEKALYIGDKEKTVIRKGEICYFDQIGPYNLDFNYRDAIRTSVTEKTRNIIINTEGIFDITREQVERTLREVIDNIMRFCGGKLEIAGIITAS